MTVLAFLLQSDLAKQIFIEYTVRVEAVYM